MCAQLTGKQIFEHYSEYVSKGKVDFFRKFRMDLVMAEREGIRFRGKDGREWINCHCNGGVFNLGHRHPEVMRAVREALEKYDIGNHHLISEPRALLARKLVELAPPGLAKVVFGVSGGEAIDFAIKLAMGVTGRQKIISARGGYHGHTGLALAAGEERFRKPFHFSLPNFIRVPFGDIKSLESVIDDQTAAVILEPIPATLGMVIPRDSYLPAVRELCSRYGALFIADEVQTGLGRTGRFWAVEHWEAWPDILVTGKGLSGGIYPITAAIFRREFERIFEEDPFVHISTFGGSEVGCFAALKVLEISSQPGFLEHVRHMAELFRQKLEALQFRFRRKPFEIRQKGLMMGLKFPDETQGMGICKFLYDEGVFAVFSGNDPSVLQFLPPLIVQEKDAVEIIDRLERALHTMYGLKGRLLLTAMKVLT